MFVIIIRMEKDLGQRTKDNENEEKDENNEFIEWQNGKMAKCFHRNPYHLINIFHVCVCVYVSIFVSMCVCVFVYVCMCVCANLI